ncbi:MAG: hypothetical protein QXJ17_07095 [Nitrososphaeria archaeon]
MKAQGNFEFISSVWGSYSNPQKAYPGSTNVALMSSFRNDRGVELISVTGTLYLPQGIESYDGKSNATSTGSLQRNGTTSFRVKPGEIFQFIYTLRVLESTPPGAYDCVTEISYTYFDGASYVNEHENATTTMTISDYPIFSFQVIDNYWTTTGGYRVNASPGARNFNFNIVLKNVGEDGIDELTAALKLGSNFFPSEATSNANNVGKGDTFTLMFSPISIPATTDQGTYVRELQLNCTFLGYGNVVSTTSYTVLATLIISPHPSPNLQIVSIHWSNFDKNYPGAKKVMLDVEVQNLGEFTITDTLVSVNLPNGFMDSYGKSTINATSSTSIAYGDFALITIGPIYIGAGVSSGAHHAEAEFTCVGSRDGSQLILKQNFTLPIVVSGISFYIDLTSVSWTYNGQPAVALPGASNIVLSIGLVNRGEDTLSGMKASVQAPSGFKLIGSSYSTGPIPSASQLNMNFNFNLSQSLNAGVYNIPITLMFNVNPDSGNSMASTKIIVPVNVEDSSRYNSNLILVNAYWGTSGNPRPVYPGSKFVPLTLELSNRGLYPIRGAYLKLTSDTSFKGIVEQVDLVSTIASGGSATTTLYLSLDESIKPGKYNFTVLENYFLEVYGAQLIRSRNITFQLEVFEPLVKAPYLKLISGSWANGNPVYPGTENATFNILIANQAPYSITGLSAALSLPRGFTRGSQNGLEAYVAGPIGQWQTATLSFSVNVGADLTPTNYVGKLQVEYTLLSGGDNLRIVEGFDVTVGVNKLGGFETIYSNWLGSSPGPGSTGAILLILVRNNDLPQMRGVYASVKLPEGFSSTFTGLRNVNITPTIYGSTAQIQDIVSLLSGQIQFPSQYTPTPQTQAGRGDIIALQIQVNVDESTKLGNYVLDFELNFIDPWNSILKADSKASFWLPGATRTIDIVEGKSKLFIGVRTASIQLFLKNNGTAPIKDVYVAIGGAPQGISVSSAIKYLPEIAPKNEVNMSWLASVNPQTPYTGSLPIVVVINYADILGNRRTFNQTAIIYVEGVIEIKLMDTSITPEVLYSADTITVSTTLLNLGTYKARNVEAVIAGDALLNVSGNYAYVGDVDVGAQVPVSLTSKLREGVGDKTLYLVINYRNVFNEPVTLTFPINVTVVQKPTQTETTKPIFFELGDTYRFALMIAIVFFLVVSGYIIYKMYQKTKQQVPA